MKYLYSSFEYPFLVIILLQMPVLVFVVLWSGTGSNSVVNKSYHVGLTLINSNTFLASIQLWYYPYCQIHAFKWSIHFCLLVIIQRFLAFVIRGILSVAWCARDPDLLLSCGKDNRILCWNPNSPTQTDEVRRALLR